MASCEKGGRRVKWSRFTEMYVPYHVKSFSGKALIARKRTGGEQKHAVFELRRWKISNSSFCLQDPKMKREKRRNVKRRELLKHLENPPRYRCPWLYLFYNVLWKWMIGQQRPGNSYLSLASRLLCFFSVQLATGLECPFRCPSIDLNVGFQPGEDVPHLCFAAAGGQVINISHGKLSIPNVEIRHVADKRLSGIEASAKSVLQGS